MKNEPLWSKFFKFRQGNDVLPNPAPGIYEIATLDERWLKVGISKNVKKRLQQHLASGGLRDRFGRAINAPGDSEHPIKAPSDLESHQSILAKHLYFDEELGSEYQAYDLKSKNGRHKFLRDHCKFRYKLTKTKKDARNLEILLEDSDRYRYRGAVKVRRRKTKNDRSIHFPEQISPAHDSPGRPRTSAENKLNDSELLHVESEMRSLLEKLFEVQNAIKKRLECYADGKKLKGNEIVGWLGEIYTKLLFNGKLVDDSKEHDVVAHDNETISVKTRRGTRRGWKTTSAIPKTDGLQSPTHLAFVHLNDDYSVDRVWLFEWVNLVANRRFVEKIVRGENRGYEFTLNEKSDANNVIYSKRQSGANSS